ncbi:MAG: DUF1887 family protein [Paludibacteraceae bacterium]|nr:DUF1887 family protein [Paludibacteraceae bacterium]
MKTILISILSDYLQPNFLLIKEFDGKYDKLIFITTQEMKGKGKGRALEKALGLADDSVQRIEVFEDDYSDVKQKLEKCSFDADDEYILNVTGGTKVIPIAVCDFFKNFNSQFYYVPIGKNIVRNIYSDETIPLNYRLSLSEYFTLNGLRYDPSDEVLFPLSQSRMVFNEYKQVGFKRQKHKKISDSHHLPDAKERLYYSGAWFEDYCYWRLKKEFELDDNAICKGAKIFRGESVQHDNEIDVMFIRNNELYIFECKISITTTPAESDKEVLDKYMYKLAAIAKDYGFRPKSYILTLQNIKQKWSDMSLSNVEKRLKILGISGFLDCNDFSKEGNLLCFNEPMDKTQSGGMKPKVMPKLSDTPKCANDAAVYTTKSINMGVKVVGKIDLDKIRRK